MREAASSSDRASRCSPTWRASSAMRDRRPARARRSGPVIDVDGLAAFDSDILPGQKGGPICYDPTLEPHLLGSVLVSAVFEAFMTIVRRKTERFFRLAGVDPLGLGRTPLSDALVKVARAGGQRHRRAVPVDLHSRDRLLPAVRHGIRRVPARPDHRRRRSRAERQVGIPRSADALVPPPADFPRSRAVHDRRRGPMAAARQGLRIAGSRSTG